MNKLIVSKVYTIEIESEICCDQCNEIIHNHIAECPICKKRYTSTDQNCSLWGEEEFITTIQCDECNSYFQLVYGKWYGTDDPDEEDSNEDYWYPRVILVEPDRVVDLPIKESKVEPKEPEYKVDSKLIDSMSLIRAMKNFKLFEPLK